GPRLEPRDFCLPVLKARLSQRTQPQRAQASAGAVSQRSRRGGEAGPLSIQPLQRIAKPFLTRGALVAPTALNGPSAPARAAELIWISGEQSQHAAYWRTKMPRMKPNRPIGCDGCL